MGFRISGSGLGSVELWRFSVGVELNTILKVVR